MKNKAASVLFFLVLLAACYTCATSRRIGATCWDGTESGASGSGACSHWKIITD